MQFLPAVTPPPETDREAWWFLFYGDRLLVETCGDEAAVPRGLLPGVRGLRPMRTQYLGTLDGVPCYGGPTQPLDGERARTCPGCGIHFFPRVTPAVIVAVVRDRKILLAQARRFPSAFYSVLAGFVEPGETFEECVRREVREEVGIEVENLRYFGSQPWPFPHSLMVGFTAEYAGGDLAIEEKEIVRAGWFDADEIARLSIPRHGTIARRLIEWFLDRKE